MSHPRTRRLSAVALAALLVVAGCGGDSDDDAGAGGAGPTTSPADGAGRDGAAGDGEADGGSVADGEDGDGGDAVPAGEPRPSAGCGSTDQGAEVEAERTLEVAGQARRYLLTVPGAHDGTTPLPVVLDFHGLMEGAEVHSKMSAYSALAEEEGFVVVFPHGTGNPIHWNTGAGPANPDLAYVDAVLAELSGSLCVDESRIYATGLSNGAMFTSRLLCERADVIAAAAPVAGITRPEPCDQARPVPLVTFHGTADPILLFNGGVDLGAIPGNGAEGGAAVTTTTRPPADLDGEGHPAAVAAWAAANGCEAEPTDSELTDEVVHRVYDCPDGADVEFYIVVDGGHTWPSSEFSMSIGDIVGHTTTDVDATADAWTFMRRFRTG